MPFIVFDESFRIGHEEIDCQHAALFEAVNRLHDSMMGKQGREEMGRVLAFLREYTVTHFETEERIMRESGFPRYAIHKNAHDQLVKKSWNSRRPTRLAWRPCPSRS